MGFSNLTLGIYDKALPASMSWAEKLATVKEASFDFIEISIDESNERLNWLDWSQTKRASLREEIRKSGIPITSMCLSGHRRFPIGSTNPQIRNTGLDILKKAIDFALDIGIKLILVPGYDVFYEESTPKTEKIFIESLLKAKDWSTHSMVMLALENTDKYVTSIRHARSIIDKTEAGKIRSNATKNVIHYHHERWDDSGYPEKKEKKKNR